MTPARKIRVALVVAIGSAFAWIAFGAGVQNYGFWDDCGNAIISRAPGAVWLAMLVSGLVMASSTTTWTILRRANQLKASRGLATVVWFAFAASALWALAFREGLPYSGCDYGRPKRDRDGRASLPSTRHRRRVGRSSPSSRSLTRHWLQIARGEYASIGAFVDLEQSLLALGAPDRLVAGCRRAQVQERRHAALAADLVERWSGARPRFVHEASPTITTDLARIAVESYLDGCLNEGAAAAEAAVRRDGVTDQQVRAVLDVIATDEAEHAELAWAIIEWAVAVHAPTTIRALESARARTTPARRGIRRPFWMTTARARTLGWIDPELCRRVHPDIVAAAEARLSKVLESEASECDARDTPDCGERPSDHHSFGCNVEPDRLHDTVGVRVPG